MENSAGLWGLLGVVVLMFAVSSCERAESRARKAEACAMWQAEGRYDMMRGCQ